MFNQRFYTPQTNYTRESAEKRLISLGYKNFSFKGSSYTNGASFYFTNEKGEEIRVSDHRLTGKRAFDCIQVDLIEVSTIGCIKKEATKIEAKVYSVGENVKHSTMGAGVVIEMDEVKGAVKVQFANQVKTFLTQFIKLEKL